MRVPLAVALLLIPGLLWAASYAKVDQIVAVVDDDLVMRSELDAKVKQAAVQLRQSGGKTPSADVLDRQVLEQLINRRVQLNAAKKAGVTVDDGLVAKALNGIAERNRMNLGQFRGALEHTGINFDNFKKGIEEEFLINRYLSQAVLGKIQVSDQEISAYLAKDARLGDAKVSYHVGHILVPVPSGAESGVVVKAREKADAIAAKLRAGGSFQEAAMQHSSTENALQGGDLGWLSRDELPSAIADKVAGMGVGELSGPIRGGGGFHIVKLFERKGSANRSLVDQTHVRHILVRTSDRVSDQDAKTRLEQLRLRIVGGDDFSALARAHSNDTASAVKGGDLGWISPNDVLPAFQQEMAALQPNQVSQPFKTEMGWHLLQVLERRNYDNTDDLRRNQAAQAIKQRKGKDAIEQFVRTLRDEAYVEVRLGQPASD